MKKQRAKLGFSGLLALVCVLALLVPFSSFLMARDQCGLIQQATGQGCDPGGNCGTAISAAFQAAQLAIPCQTCFQSATSNCQVDADGKANASVTIDYSCWLCNGVPVPKKKFGTVDDEEPGHGDGRVRSHVEF